MERRRQLTKKKIMRWLVIAAIYLGMVWAALVAVLGCIWLVKNTVFGIWLLLGTCLLLGGWLFLGMREEALQNRRHTDSLWDFA